MRLILLVNSLELDGLFVSNVQFNAFRSQVHLQISCDRDHQAGGIVAVGGRYLGRAGPYACQRDRKVAYMVSRFDPGGRCRDHALGAVSEFRQRRPCHLGYIEQIQFQLLHGPGGRLIVRDQIQRDNALFPEHTHLGPCAVVEVDRFFPGAVRSLQHGGEGIILPLQSRVAAGEAVLAVDRGAVFHIGDPVEPSAQLFLEVVGCLVAPVRHIGVVQGGQAVDVILC